MDDGRAEIGEAQVVFREANETIQASADRFSIVTGIPFVCECADRSCSEIVRLSFDEYDAIRQHPRRFFNVTGHEQTSVEAAAERIVTVVGTLTVVEKVGIAGEIAGRGYPRHAE